MKLLLAVSCFFILIGCSSFYYHPDRRTLLQANIFMKNGQTLDNQAQYSNALYTYFEAYQRYSLIDQLDGKALAMLALTREYYRLGDMRNFDLWRDSVSTLIKLNIPKMEDQLKLLDIEINFRNSDYAKVIELTKGYQNKQILTATEFCSYRLISKTKLNTSLKIEKDFLLEQIQKLSKQYHKHKLDEPSKLAFAYYSIGYSYILQTQFKKALGMLLEAYKIDQSEENFSNITSDLYLIGFTYEQLKQLELAQDYYTRGLNIAIQITDKELQDKINDRLKNLNH